MDAEDLEIGDLVLALDGDYGIVEATLTEAHTQTMYDLDVAIVDTFAVGDGAWVVHNQNFGPCDLPDGLENWEYHDAVTNPGRYSPSGRSPWMSTRLDRLTNAQKYAEWQARLETVNNQLVNLPPRPEGQLQYSVYFEAQLTRLDEPIPNRSRNAHFRRGNQQLVKALDSNYMFYRHMETMFPGIRNLLRPPGTKGTLPVSPSIDGMWSLTWHHHPSREGVLQLVLTQQHTTEGVRGRFMHPNNRGGHQKWGENY